LAKTLIFQIAYHSPVLGKSRLALMRLSKSQNHDKAAAERRRSSGSGKEMELDANYANEEIVSRAEGKHVLCRTDAPLLPSLGEG
jgi:hypothetical protein